MSGRSQRSARHRWMTAPALGLVMLATGCTATRSSSEGPAVTSRDSTTRSTPATPSIAPAPSSARAPSGAPGTSGAPAPSTASSSRRTSAPTATVTRTSPGAVVTVTVAPPRATAQPPATDGSCPYLGADVVSEITGQHHGPTQLIRFDPQPMCVFYRSDGGRMGSVRVIRAASAAAAAAAVDQHVPIAGSQPATAPAGWTGGSVTSPGQMTQDSQAMSIYAVSKGTIAVVAQENESPSLKARLMAVCAIYGLGLEPGPAPDYCADPQQ